MEHVDEQDILRIKDLLRRTGEFIAYFELAETKMMEWHQDIDKRTEHQEKQFEDQLKSIQIELNSLQEIFTMAGLAKFRQATDQVLTQGQSYLKAMQETQSNILNELSAFKTELNTFSDNAVQRLEKQTTLATEAIKAEFQQYDTQTFSQLAKESCQQVEQAANHAIQTSSKFLKFFNWRTAALSVLTTLLTAFAIGLYVSDEYPWEIHQHAMNERGAGKLLMNAWPKLSYKEKVKILGEQDAHKMS
jgi:hypothetical protein